LQARMGPARPPLHGNFCRREAMKRTKKVILDKDMARVGIALRRAAKQARKIAIQTNTPLVVWENGRVVKKKLTGGKHQ